MPDPLPLSPPDLAEIRGRHAAPPFPPTISVACMSCSAEWPCVVIRLLDHVAALEAALRALVERGPMRSWPIVGAADGSVAYDCSWCEEEDGDPHKPGCPWLAASALVGDPAQLADQLRPDPSGKPAC